MCEEISKIEKIVPIEINRIKIVMLFFLNLITCFLISLFIVWYPKLKLIFIYSVAKLEKAKLLAIYGKGNIFIKVDKKLYFIGYSEISLPEINQSHLKTFCKTSINQLKIKVFQFKLFKYLYNPVSNNFTALSFIIKNSQEIIHKHFLKGLNDEEYDFQKKIFGTCDLDIEVDSSLKLLLKEVTDPFYIFQVFSVTLWFFNSYIKYAVIIVITTIISLFISVYETRSNLLNIKNMAKYSCQVKVFRLKNVSF